MLPSHLRVIRVDPPKRSRQLIFKWWMWRSSRLVLVWAVGIEPTLLIGEQIFLRSQRLDADVLVIAGIVHLVELVAVAELGTDRVPQELHHLDARPAMASIEALAAHARGCMRPPVPQHIR